MTARNLLPVALVGILLSGGTVLGAVPVTILDINPDRSELADAAGASGGRVTGLGADVGDRNTFYAASEWGGLFKSTDRGVTWSHLDGHTPTATWDVEVDPSDSRQVYATSFFDGRVNSQAGINVSTDGGVTWTHPTTATPPQNFCDGESRRAEPAAFGISIDPSDPRNVYVGTNCGLAVSNNSGVTWRFVDPTPADAADDIWDVVVHGPGIIDLCGDDGHQRSVDGGATWTTAASNPLPSGRCSIAASPTETYVLYAVVGVTIYESNDGGATWPTVFTNPNPQGRIPFVVTNLRTGTNFDLWFGDVELYRASCATPIPAGPGGNPRCPASSTWAGPLARNAGGHPDSGDIVFDTAALSDACPVLFSSDGGVYLNTLDKSPTCQTPAWEEPQVTPHALWGFDLAGVAISGPNREDLYFGNQDNGTFGTRNAGDPKPNWTNERCCDGFDVAGDTKRVLNTVCCYSTPPSPRLYLSEPGFSGTSPQINTYPPGTLLRFNQLDSIATFGPDQYVVVTTQGVYITNDIGASPIIWTQLGAGSTPSLACGVQVAGTGGATSFFVKNGGCNGESGGSLWRYDGTTPGGTWQQIVRANGGSFGIYAVDPNDPDRNLRRRSRRRERSGDGNHQGWRRQVAQHASSGQPHDGRRRLQLYKSQRPDAVHRVRRVSAADARRVRSF